jgi:short-subunit dehydrogenase
MCAKERKMAVEKKALVTGASEGIGREFVLQLEKEGYAVTAVARNEIRLQELMKELKGTGHSYRIADLSSTKDLQKVSQELESEHYDLLINNAGFGVYGAFYTTPVQKYQEMLQLNINALVQLSSSFLKKAKKGDALINVSSTLALLPMPINGVYSATKAFVTSFSESLWYEQKPRGIYVMNLCPGVTKTQFHDRAGGKEGEKPPESITQTADQVVKLAIRALRKRSQPTVISGAPNIFMAQMARVMPRKAVVKMMGNLRK